MAHIQSDIRFISPPAGATALNPLNVKQYLPKDGQLALLADKGGKPHIIQGENFRIQIGKKPAGRHLVMQLTAADPILVKIGREEIILDAGVYYVELARGGAGIPSVQ